MSNQSNQEIQKRVVDVICNYAGIAAESVEVSHTMQDMGLDSLDLVEIVMELEDEFEMEISDEDAEKFTDVNSVVLYITERLSA